MPENKDIEQLLKNIQEGLKKFTVKELNDAIISFLNKKDDKSQEIEFVLSLICEEFNTNLRTLTTNVRGILHEGKQIAYCVLHFNLGLSTRYIADKIFNNWHTSVHTGIQRFKNCNMQIKQDREFMERYELISKRFFENFTKEK